MTLATALFERIERCYDGIPRRDGARVEQVGPLDLFVREGVGWPYYARPRLGSATVTAFDVERVRSRQRSLGVPEALEWVDEITPSLRLAAVGAGLLVTDAPLMVLDPAKLHDPGRLSAASVHILDPSAETFPREYAVARATASLGFGHGGTERGTEGTAQRDAAVKPLDPEWAEWARGRAQSGLTAHAVAVIPGEGVLATGSLQSAEGCSEVVGVATLPAARKRGRGAAVSSALARHALASGSELVFLSAASEAVARVYARIGFQRIGTACIAAP